MQSFLHNTKYYIRKSIENICHDMQVSLVEPLPAQAIRYRPKYHHECDSTSTGSVHRPESKSQLAFPLPPIH